MDRRARKTAADYVQAVREPTGPPPPPRARRRPTVEPVTDPSGGSPLGAVSASNGVLYAGSMSGHMYALDAANGKVLRDMVGQGSSNAGPAISNDGVVYWGNGYARFGLGAGSTGFYAFSINGK